MRPSSAGPERMYEPNSTYITAYGQARNNNHSQSGKELGGSHYSVPNTPSGGVDSTHKGERTFSKSKVASAPITRTSSWPWIAEGEGTTGDAVWGGGAREENDSESEGVRGNALSLLKIELECVGRKDYMREIVTATVEDYDVTDSDKNSEKDRVIGDDEGEGEGEGEGGTEDLDLEPTSPSVVSTKSDGKNGQGQSVQQLLNPKVAKKNNTKQKKKTQKK